MKELTYLAQCVKKYRECDSARIQARLSGANRVANLHHKEALKAAQKALDKGFTLEEFFKEIEAYEEDERNG